jgi:hypothetical protein
MKAKLSLGVTLACLSLCLCASPLPARGQEARGREPSCESLRRWSGAKHCEVREQSAQAPQGSLFVDGRAYDSVTVRGWNRGDVLVRALVSAWGDSEADARATVRRTRVEVTGDAVRAVQGGDNEGQRAFITYEIFVPRSLNLKLKTQTGGIQVYDMMSRMELRTHDGGISLVRVGGSVTGESANGGLHVVLGGERWEGEGLDVRTTNGGVLLSVPEGYSARLETGTRLGSLTANLSLGPRERYRNMLSLDLGAGGPTVRVVTANGGVIVKRQKTS